jgi:DtxR family Mn-dependent transcriptional regulator
MTDLTSSLDESQAPSPTPTVEDYLWLIFTLQRDGEEVIGARLAELLEVSAPTVTVTLKRMVRDGWVVLDQHKRIVLTLEGKKAAKTVLRRHMLVEWLLVDMLNVPWSRLHEEAHQLEHYISDDIEERLAKQLGNPVLCPHGNPVPGNEKEVEDWINLLDAPLGKDLIIKRIHEHAENRPALMKFFEENQVLPGKQIKVIEKLSFNDTVSLEVESESVVLGTRAAGYIFVELISG